jgi:hypothetical protein
MRPKNWPPDHRDTAGIFREKAAAINGGGLFPLQTARMHLMTFICAWMQFLILLEIRNKP